MLRMLKHTGIHSFQWCNPPDLGVGLRNGVSSAQSSSACDSNIKVSIGSGPSSPDVGLRTGLIKELWVLHHSSKMP